MSGKILIVDDLATNRIILKARLSAAYYQVIQARSGDEAIRLATTEHPDLLLVNARLPDMDGVAFIQALRQSEGPSKLPVVMLIPENAPNLRLELLHAGVSDVFEKPLEEPLLMAKLRSLLRQKNAHSDLQLHTELTESYGLAEDSRAFQRQGKLAVISTDKSRVISLRAALARHHQFDVTVFENDAIGCFHTDASQPDVFLFSIGAADREASLALMAEIQTNPHTRHCRIMARLHSDALLLAPTLLDMGAHDIVTEATDPAEMLMRLRILTDQKHQTDRLRNQLHKRLKAAVIDPLTGLYNRRYALPYLNRMVAGITCDSADFAVMVADLDHFKQVNDTYGHAAGDTVLTCIAQLLRQSLRDEGMIARIGGEEFLIVLPNTNRSEARQTAGRLRRLIQRTPIPLGPSHDPIHVTTSIGVTLCGPSSDAVRPTADKLLGQADRALYGAKAEGRNTVTLSSRNAA